MKLPKIVLKRHEYNGQSCLFFYFHYNLNIVNRLRSFPDKSFSKTKGVWFIEEQLEKIERVRAFFQGYAEIEIDTSNNQYIEEQKSPSLPPLSQKQIQMTEELRQYMRVRRYSAASIHSYIEGLSVFLRFSGKEDPYSITHEDLEHFNDNYIIKPKRSASYQNVVINAIKLFVNTFTTSHIDPEMLERP